MKRRMTQREEFEIFKLVIDKFLWLGFGVMAFGFYKLAVGGLFGAPLLEGVAFMITGFILLMLLVFVFVKEFEIIR